MTGEWAAPCDWPEPEQLELDLAAAEQAFTDLHGPQPVRRYVPPEGPTVAPLYEYGRSASRPSNWLRARVHALDTGSYL